jgi:hypothetical protein
MRNKVGGREEEKYDVKERENGKGKRIRKNKRKRREYVQYTVKEVKDKNKKNGNEDEHILDYVMRLLKYCPSGQADMAGGRLSALRV